MSAVTILMAAMTGFVLLAPVAMAVVLVSGGVPIRRPVAVIADAVGCGCVGDCVCAAPVDLPAAA